MTELSTQQYRQSPNERLSFPFRVAFLALALTTVPQLVWGQGVSTGCLLSSDCVIMWTSSVGVGYRLDDPGEGERPYLEIEMGRLESNLDGSIAFGPSLYSAIDINGDARLGLMARHRRRAGPAQMSLGVGALAFDTRGHGFAPMARIDFAFWRSMCVDLGVDVIRHHGDAEFAWYTGIRYSKTQDGRNKLIQFGLLALSLTTVILYSF